MCNEKGSAVLFFNYDTDTDYAVNRPKLAEIAVYVGYECHNAVA